LKNPGPNINQHPLAYVLWSTISTRNRNIGPSRENILSKNLDAFTLNLHSHSQSQVSFNPDSSHELDIIPAPSPSLSLNSNELNCNLNIFSNYTPAQILKSDQLGPLNPITLVCGRSG
jgi:hypothetical protein